LTVNQRQRGELESFVVNQLWDSPDGLTCSELCARFDEPTPALTTIATVLERLRSKGEVRRAKSDARGYKYFATDGRVAVLTNEMTAALARGNDRASVLLNFAGVLTDADREILRRALELE
jgi:predicted transcriptional regulator